jgi:hypothetical protein
MATPHPFDLLMEHAARILAEGLGGARPTSRPAAKAARSSAAAPAPRGRRRKGQKRDPALIAETTESLLAYIKAHPRKRIEEIAAGMRVSTKDLNLSTKKLMADKRIQSEGQKRATRYRLA